MDKFIFKKLKHKPIEACCVKIIKKDYLSPDFSIDLYNNNLTTGTGWLTLGCIKSKEMIFILRWDEDDDLIDVDMKNLKTKESSKKFYGHHSRKLKFKNSRRYLINIRIKDNKEEVLIFKGILEIIIKTSTRLEKTLEYRIKLPNGEIK